MKKKSGQLDSSEIRYRVSTLIARAKWAATHERTARSGAAFSPRVRPFGAVLTRSLGVRRLDLVEDVVQAALV